MASSEFFSKAGSCNSVCTKLWALRLGIKLAQDLSLALHGLF